MLLTLKRLAVETVKPRVSGRTWKILRDPLARRPALKPKPPTEAERMRAMSLDQLAAHFKTDKWGAHFYTEHYERHLGHLRDESFTLLEIGIGGYTRQRQGGASLLMWKAFFPNAEIIGLDIEDKSFLNQDRIRTYRGSQADPEVLQRILDDVGEIKVVIDDGSHRPEHIRESMRYLFPALCEDGVYAIEDLQTSYWPIWGGSAVLNDPHTSASMVKDLIDGLHYEEFTDDDYQPTYVDRHLRSIHAYHNLAILEKGSNVEGSSRARKKRTFDEADPRYVGAPPVQEQRRPYSVSSVENVAPVGQ